MKEIELIKIESGIALIHEGQDYFQHPNFELPATFIENTDMASLAHSYVEVENIPIRRIIENDIEHYIAVHNKVWEYLYLIENPVTAKSQHERIERLSSEICNLRISFDNTSHTLSSLCKSLHNATLWTRIKWVFTGWVSK